MRLFVLVLAIVTIGTGCAETLDDPTPYLASARVLAVSMDPPEAPTNTSVRFTALYADASGALTTGPLAFDYCLAQKPLAELGPVAPTCYDPGSASLVAITPVAPAGTPQDTPPTGLDAAGAIPIDACRLFGPDSPPSTGNGPGGRPVDPDSTGGFYQPVVVFATDGSSKPTLAQVRVSCGLAGVTPTVADAYAHTYHANRNPGIASLTIARGDNFDVVPPIGSGTPPTVARGEVLTLRVAWSACPDTSVCGDGLCTADETLATCPVDCTTPAACGAETYVVYDAASDTLVSQREGLSVTYFANAGTFDEARTGVDGSDVATDTTNTWTAPSTSGDAYLAIVLRDARGGLSFASYRIHVAP